MMRRDERLVKHTLFTMVDDVTSGVGSLLGGIGKLLGGIGAMLWNTPSGDAIQISTKHNGKVDIYCANLPSETLPDWKCLVKSCHDVKTREALLLCVEESLREARP